MDVGRKRTPVGVRGAGRLERPENKGSDPLPQRVRPLLVSASQSSYRYLGRLFAFFLGPPLAKAM